MSCKLKFDLSRHARESKAVSDSGFHAVNSNSRYWNPDFLSVEFGFRNPIVNGIPDSLSRFSDSTRKKCRDISGIRIPLHWERFFGATAFIFLCLCLFLLFGYSRQPLQREFEFSDNTLLSTLWQNNHNRSFLKPSHRIFLTLDYLPFKQTFGKNTILQNVFILQNPKLSILI